MRNPIKLSAAAVGGVLLVGGLGAVTAIGENATETTVPKSAELAERVQPRVAELAREAHEAETIEFAGALHDDRVTNYALAVYDNEVKRQEAERIAAAAAAAAAAEASSSSSYSGGGGAGGNLASIRACESGGNYSTNTGNGFYGAYQFDQQTWNSVGGGGNPANASPAEQDARAQALVNRSGSSPWPSCG
jgi:hypothetical protein